MADYPDWQRAFRIVGSEITIPISIQSQAVTLNVNIAASAITLNVSITNAQVNVNIAASAITLNVNLSSSSITLNVNLSSSSITLNVNITNAQVSVNLAASAITLNVNLSSSSITLNVNISSSSITINMKFTDQSVAVFDAAKWFAKQAAQISAIGVLTLLSGASGNAVTRTVPAGKTFFITGYGFAQDDGTAAVAVHGLLIINAIEIAMTGGNVGGSVIFDTPMRATAGQLVALELKNLSTATRDFWGGFWGYDE